MPILETFKYARVVIDNENMLTATPDDVLEGRNFVGLHKVIETGTIPIIEQSDVRLFCDQKYTVPFGYNQFPYDVIAVSLADQTISNALDTDIMAGKTAWVNGVRVEGVIPDIADTTITLQAGEHYTIPYGRHSGNGVVQAADLTSQTGGDATEADILLSKKAWVNGKLITGTMPNNTPEEIVLDAGKDYTIPLGYHSGKGVVKAKDLAAQTPGTAEASDIVEGETAWVNGVQITGTIPEIPTADHELELNGEYVIPYGLHSGLGKVVQHIPEQEAFTITPHFQEQEIEVQGKYMTGNITVTGIDALNYKKFNNPSESVHYEKQSTTTSASPIDINLGHIAVDNWHDNVTSNVYRVKLTINTEERSVVVFANGLNQEETSASVSSVNGTGYNLEVSHVFRENDYAHEFHLKGTITANIEVEAWVYEIMSLRQYGDEHDVDE